METGAQEAEQAGQGGLNNLALMAGAPARGVAGQRGEAATQAASFSMVGNRYLVRLTV